MSKTAVSNPNANVSTDAASDLGTLSDDLCWLNARCPVPGEGRSKEGLRGENVVGYWVDELDKREKEFTTVLKWMGLILGFLYVFHVPAVSWARMKVQEERRERLRKSNKPHPVRRTHARETDVNAAHALGHALLQAIGIVHQTNAEEDAKASHLLRHKVHHMHTHIVGPSLVERFANSAPRLEHYGICFGIQSLSMVASFTLVISEEASTLKKIGAVLTLLVWPIGPSKCSPLLAIVDFEA